MFCPIPLYLTRSQVDSDNVRGIAQTVRILTLLHLKSFWLDNFTRNICLYQDFRSSEVTMQSHGIATICQCHCVSAKLGQCPQQST